MGKDKTLVLPRVISMEKKGRFCKVTRQSKQKDKISQDDDSLSLFKPADVEDDLQQEMDDTLRKVMFVFNDTEPPSESHTLHKK